MAKKNNPKAEKAKRNLEYARAHRKKQRTFGRGGRPPRPSFGESRPPQHDEARPAGDAAPRVADAPAPAPLA